MQVLHLDFQQNVNKQKYSRIHAFVYSLIDGERWPMEQPQKLTLTKSEPVTSSDGIREE